MKANDIVVAIKSSKGLPVEKIGVISAYLPETRTFQVYVGSLGRFFNYYKSEEDFESYFKLHIKPCPFCGSKANIHMAFRDTCHVRCSSKVCHLNQGTNELFISEGPAIEAWNKRPTDAGKEDPEKEQVEESDILFEVRDEFGEIFRVTYDEKVMQANEDLYYDNHARARCFDRWLKVTLAGRK